MVAEMVTLWALSLVESVVSISMIYGSIGSTASPPAMPE